MMNKEKELIENIQSEAEKFKNSEFKSQYQEQENMKAALADNLYSKNSHFIYELIQNAEDNTYSDEVTPSIVFQIDDKGILTKNNEIGFNEENIRSICKFSSSSKKGHKNLGFIGEKGLGFKSVFAISSLPAIFSNNYQFYFKEGEYSIPYWISDQELKKYPTGFIKKNSTNIYLKYKDKLPNKYDINKEITEIEPTVILFLKKLSKIEIHQHNKLVMSVSKESSNAGIFRFDKIKSGNNFNGYYLIHSEINKPDNVDEPKREKINRREIILAFPTLKNESAEDRVFAFLPTEIRTNLHFIIQGDFILIGNRENIIEDNRWNMWLMDELVNLFVNKFTGLRDIDETSKFQYLRYLEPEKSTSKFIDIYYQKILNNLKNEQLFLSTDGLFYKSNEINILKDHDFMFEYIGDLNKKYCHKDFYIPKHIINNWKISVVDRIKFLQIICDEKEYFSSKFENNNLLFEKLLEYIKDEIIQNISKLEYIKREIILNILKRLPIIPVNNTQEIIEFYSADELNDFQVFFKLDKRGELNHIFPNSKVIAAKYVGQLEGIKFYSSILNIKQPIITDILNSLDQKFYEDDDNNTNLLVYIKNNCGNEEDTIFECLSNEFWFLSEPRNIPQELYIETAKNIYISNDYSNESIDTIDNLVNRYCDETGKTNTFFISGRYLEKDIELSDKSNEEIKREWVTFFNKIGINDEIRLNDSNNSNNISFLNKNFKLKDLNKKDSVFLFNKLVSLVNQKPHILDDWYYDSLDWRNLVKDCFPIYINDQQSAIKDIYFNVPKKLKDLCLQLPDEYRSGKFDIIKKIFNIKESPKVRDVLMLIKNKSLNEKNDAISVFKYLDSNTEDSAEFNELIEIPVFNDDDSIIYVSRKQLIWDCGKEFKLINIKDSYDKALKDFFTNKMKIPTRPTVEQYLEYLKTKPDNYKKVFDLFIESLSSSEEIYDGLLDEKIVNINGDFASLRDVIINDEFIHSYNYSLLNFDKRYKKNYEIISKKYDIRKISDCEREISIENEAEADQILDVYFKILNFTWDLLYSENADLFNKLKENREFILKTKEISQCYRADINMRIFVGGDVIDNQISLHITESSLYLSNNIRENVTVKEIAKFIVSELGDVENIIHYDRLEKFYDKVHKYQEFNVIEYYQEELIRTPESEEDQFENVFRRIFNEIDNAEDDENEKEDDFSDIKEEDCHRAPDLKWAMENHGNRKLHQTNDEDIHMPPIVTDASSYSSSAKKNIDETRKIPPKEGTKVNRKNPPNEAETKKFLLDQYNGHCQICKFTFKESNGKIYFVNSSIFKTVNSSFSKDSVDSYFGSALCLCPNCDAIRKNCNVNFGRMIKLSPQDDIFKDNEAFINFISDGLDDETGELYKIPILFNNESRYLHYSKAHLLEWKELYTYENNAIDDKLYKNNRLNNELIINGRKIFISKPRIDLNNLQLTQLPEEIKFAENMTILSIENNNISNIPDEYFSNTESSTITIYAFGNDGISYNTANPKLNVKTDPEWYFILMKWKDDYEIDDNKLPKDYSKLQNLTELNLANTNIEDIPEEIANLASLTKINLLNSGLENDYELPRSILEMTNLRELKLHRELFNSNEDQFDQIRDRIILDYIIT